VPSATASSTVWHAHQAGDVGVEADEAIRDAALVAQRDAARQHVAHAAVAVQQPHLVLEARVAAVEMACERRFETGAIVRVDAREPRRAVVADVLRREPEHRLPARRELHRSRREVALPKTVLAAAQHEQRALLGGAALLPRRSCALRR
jgi:hypothetical protein